MRNTRQSRAFWGTLGALCALGVVAYYAGVKPQTPLEREIIPVDEPTLLDWAVFGGVILAI